MCVTGGGGVCVTGCVCPIVAEYRGGGVKTGALVHAVCQRVGKGVAAGKVCRVRGLGNVCKGRGLAHAGLCRGVRMSERADRPSNTTKAIVRTSCRLHQISTRRL